jgi:hypothetical protein
MSRLSITSIQRNRGPWIVEWVAFHLLAGFTQFHLYCHKTDDGMTETLMKLSKSYPITVHRIDVDDRPQIAAYRHAWATYGGDVDWMAFIDGDEFLFPTRHASMAEALATFALHDLSALGVYWCCYGSSGHVDEPVQGLVMENFPRHSRPDFPPNRHVKSIVRGRQDGVDIQTSHVFTTPKGTFDDRLRPLNHGWMKDLEPSYDLFRINHYAIQSHEFFRKTKQNMGAADGDARLVRPDAWYHEHDRNDCDDGVSHNHLVRLKLKVRELQAAIAAA